MTDPKESKMVRRYAILLAIVGLACGRESTDHDVLATVNGTPITHDQFQSESQGLPEKTKVYFASDKPGFLEELISRELLFQEAVRRGFANTPSVEELVREQPEMERALVIDALLEDELNKVEVSEGELREFYTERKGQFELDFTSMKPQLTKALLEQKQKACVDALLQELRERATVTRNEKWIRTQTPDNPLDRVLGKGKPVLADFGRGVCIPCKKMKPILEELKKEYQGRVHVFIIEIDPYRALTRKHRVRLIPTQIFFDSGGDEYYRHEGFMSKKDIVATLREMGVR